VADPHQALGERFEQNLVIAARPATVFDCFFSPDALRAWWGSATPGRASRYLLRSVWT